MKNVLLFLVFIFHNVWVNAQEWEIQDTANSGFNPRPKKIIINGYVKDMQSLDFPKDFKDLNSTNLIHNRINTKWLPTENLTFSFEMRNRLIWGDDVKMIPGYGKLLRNPNEKIDLSNIWFSNSTLIMHTNLDRLNVDYRFKKTGIKLGRQRINWGISTTWNPNDIFNSYNFLDFDYEERPGSDAIRISRALNSFSGVEVAFSPSNKNYGKVLAAKYFFNSNGYDFQVLTGNYGNRFTAGIGWAGSIGDAGFKGEAQFFSKTTGENNQFNLCLEGDYVFTSGWYLNSSFLYNNNGLNTRILNPLNLNFSFTPVNLMPTRWNFILSTRKEITPLFSANLSTLYAPGTNLLLILPGFRYSLSDNLDVDLIWQSFFAELQKFEALNHRGFLRLKYSF
jgi:hypothetical protein